MTILTVGIDLAKNVFAVHGVNEAGKAALVRPAVPRDKLHALIAALPPCVIGLEACSGAHHWARLFQAAGHTVRLIAPKFVSPYRMRGPAQNSEFKARQLPLRHRPQRPELALADLGVTPDVVACQVDVTPPERREMRQQAVVHRPSMAA